MSTTRRTGVAPFTITATISATRERVWTAWTQRDELVRWFCPPGCTMRVGTCDFRPGGIFHYCARRPDGHEMWGTWSFRAITPPARLELISCFCDAQGGITRHPMSPSWPQQTLSTTTLSEQDGITALTVSWVPFNATEEEHRTFDGAHASMRQGWGGTFDQLRTYLARA
jgi:uncharacterized protein YndB with AHSA1/START domain